MLEPGILHSLCARWRWYVLYCLCFRDLFLMLCITRSSISVGFPKSIIFTYLYFRRIMFVEWRSWCRIPWLCRFCKSQTKSKHTPFQCWNETKVFRGQYTPLEAYLAQYVQIHKQNLDKPTISARISVWWVFLKIFEQPLSAEYWV